MEILRPLRLKAIVCAIGVDSVFAVLLTRRVVTRRLIFDIEG